MKASFGFNRAAMTDRIIVITLWQTTAQHNNGVEISALGGRCVEQRAVS
jgi:hypothetical protein